mgnify:FL=1
MAVGLFAQQTALFNVALATFLLNLRHLFMSTVLGSRLTHHTSRWIPLVAFGVTDEVFAVASSRDTLNVRYLAGVELGAYMAWVGGTVVGAFVGSVLPESIRLSFGIALYALFTAILVIQVADELKLLVPAILAAGINGLLRIGLGVQAGTAFPIALIGGAVMGYVLATQVHWGTPGGGDEP